MEIDSVDPQVVHDLNDINGLAPEAKQAAFTTLLDTILSKPHAESIEENLNAYLVNLLGGETAVPGLQQASESLSIAVLRPVLDNFVTQFGSSKVSAEVKVSVGQTAVDLLRPRATTFSAQDGKIKEILADAYESQEDYASSARALQSIDLDNAQRELTPNDRVQVWVRIARCYLEEDNPTDASTWINKAKGIREKVTDKPLSLQLQMSEARIADSQRTFLVASNTYHKISFDPLVDEEDRLQTLSAAIVCAILTPAGPDRSRALAKLYKDERSSQLDEYNILEKIFFDRVLTAEEVSAFAAKLAPHQLAKKSDGSTVLDHAVLEHNLQGVSRLYRNIGIDNLGILLAVDGERAEQYAANMIGEGRLAGHIDQIDRIIYFDEVDVQANSMGMVELRRWDAAVSGIAEEMEKIATMIQTSFPDLYAEKMAS